MLELTLGLAGGAVGLIFLAVLVYLARNRCRLHRFKRVRRRQAKQVTLPQYQQKKDIGNMESLPRGTGPQPLYQKKQTRAPQHPNGVLAMDNKGFVPDMLTAPNLTDEDKVTKQVSTLTVKDSTIPIGINGHVSESRDIRFVPMATEGPVATSTLKTNGKVVTPNSSPEVTSSNPITSEFILKRKTDSFVEIQSETAPKVLSATSLMTDANNGNVYGQMQRSQAFARRVSFNPDTEDIARRVSFNPDTEDIPDLPSSEATDYNQLIDDSFNFDELASSQQEPPKPADSEVVTENSTIARRSTVDDIECIDIVNEEIEDVLIEDTTDDLTKTHKRTASQVSFSLPDNHEEREASFAGKRRLWKTINRDAPKNNYIVQFPTKKAKDVKLIIGQPALPHPGVSLSPGGPMYVKKSSKGPFNSSFTNFVKGKRKSASTTSSEAGDRMSQSSISRSSRFSVTDYRTGSPAGSIRSLNSLGGSAVSGLVAGSYVSTLSVGGSKDGSVINDDFIY